MSGRRGMPTRRTLRMSSQPRRSAICRASPLLLAQTVALSVCPSLAMYLTLYLCNLSASPFRLSRCPYYSNPTRKSQLQSQVVDDEGLEPPTLTV